MALPADMPPVDLAEEIRNSFFRYDGSKIYTPLPFDRCFPSDPVTAELDLFNNFISDELDAENLDKCAILRRLPDNVKAIAVYSHFCFRLVFWNNESITAPELRTGLEECADCVTVADMLRQKLDVLWADEEEETKTALLYCKRPKFVLGPWPFKFYQDLQDLVFEKVVREGFDPGFLTKEKTYQEHPEIENRIRKDDMGRRQVWSRSEAIRHLAAMAHAYYSQQRLTLSLADDPRVGAEKRKLEEFKKLVGILFEARYPDASFFDETLAQLLENSRV